MKKQKCIKQEPVVQNPKTHGKDFSWRLCSMKILVLFAAVLSLVILSNLKGYFSAHQSNNHIRRKWDSFYNYTKTTEVDVFILGNSHIINGIDPFVLSDATSSTCFFLGNSGSNIIDAWFQLGVALKSTKPKLVVLETFCINNGEKAETGSILYLRGFDTRKNLWYKIQCIPQLFNSHNCVEAWSTSIKNQSFLLADIERIKYNIKNPKEPEPRRLDLGRFARSNFGLQDSTLVKYDSIGTPAKENEYRISTFTKKYLQKIMNICDERDIPVLFLTLPMYYKHISDYGTWKLTMNEEFKKYPKAKWLDLQMPYNTVIYSPDMFENTYKKNQHLSNLGMTVNAYKLTEFIYNNYPGLLPNRSKDNKWIEDFETANYFAYNQDIASGVTGFSSIVKNKRINNFHIREFVLQENTENNRLILKIKKQDNMPNILTVRCKITMHGNSFIAPLQMYNIREIFPPHYKIYVTDIRKEVKINDVLNIEN